MADAHCAEIRDLNGLNLAQTERIKVLSMAVEGGGDGCEQSEALLQEITTLRQENEEL